jgi:hypothetical protein
VTDTSKPLSGLLLSTASHQELASALLPSRQDVATQAAITSGAAAAAAVASAQVKAESATSIFPLLEVNTAMLAVILLCNVIVAVVVWIKFARPGCCQYGTKQHGTAQQNKQRISNFDVSGVELSQL